LAGSESVQANKVLIVRIELVVYTQKGALPRSFRVSTRAKLMFDVLAADSLADGPLITEVLGLGCQQVGQVHR
jgi:hypothetical protein